MPAPAGTYTVSITGGLKRIYLNADTAIAPKLQSIEQWGDAEWTSMEAAFDGAHNMEYNASDAPDLSVVDSTAYMFYSTSFNGDLSGWDVSQVTNMNSMFNGNARFNGDLSGWDVSQVTSMISMFLGATVFDGNVSSWDVSQVTNMNSMFFNTVAFNQPLNDWNVSQVTNMNSMFSGAISFDGNLSGWNVSQVTDMNRMFRNATSFDGNLSGWNVSQVTYMNGMFATATDFNQPLSDWNVSQVTNMDGMFADATSFDGNLSGWNVSQVTSMNDMFAGASSFEQNLGRWYVVPADTAYDTLEATLNVTTVSAQNGILDGHSPNYGIGSGDDSALFNMTGSTLMFKDTPSVGSHAANVTASGSSVFEDGNNWRELKIEVAGTDNNPPEVDAGEDQTVGEGDTVTLSGSAADPDSGDSVESYSWSAPTGSGITFADASSASTTFTAPAVDGDATFTLTLTAGDGTDTGTDTMDVTVKETGSAFITTWETTSNNEEITIPGTGTYDVVWGDGKYSEDASGSASHTYAEPGTYTVAISDGLARINLGDSASDNANDAKLQSMEQWGDAEWTSMEGAFRDATNMVYNADDAPDLSRVTDMSSMFSDAYSFDGNLSSWNVSQVTDMSFMFSDAEDFNGDVSSWNVSQVTDMSFMFRASSFNGDISEWDVSSVTSMNDMFEEAYAFNGNVSSWNVSQVTGMNAMFSAAADFNQPLSSWNVSQVTNMSFMFAGASSFQQNLGKWYVVPADTAYATSEGNLNVTTISAQNSVLDGHSPEYGIGSGDDSALFNMTGSTLMFKDTPSVGSHAANVTASGGSVFENGNNWRELAITVTGADNNPPEVDAGEDQTVGEGDTVTLSGSAADPDSGDSVESYSWSAPTGSGITFADGSSASTTFTAPAVDGDATFTLTLTAGDGTDTGTDTMDVTVKETGSAFITTWETTSNNEEITIPGTGTYSVVWGDGAATDETDTAEHEYADAGNHTVSITGGLERFNLNGNSANAPKLQSIEQWGDAEWTSMGGAFHGASNMAYNATDAPDLSGVADMSYMFHGAFAFDGDLSGWDVSKVTDMSNMFRFATSFDGDVSDWNVSQVEDMTSMFDNAGSFDGNVSDWDTSSVTNMGGMFRGASTFDGDVSDWNVSQATDMNAMFRGASVFDGDVSDWDVSSVTDMNLMFYSASVFDGDVSDWDVSSVTDMNAMFYSASAFDGNISGWDVSSVTNMNAMFRASSSFDQDLSGWNVSSVTDMNAMFYSASAFDGNLSGWNVSQVTDMNSMFAGATSFQQNLGKWYVVPADTAYATSEGNLNVTTISAQNSVLDGHSPEYDIGSGDDSALFNMTGSTLMFKDTPSVGSHAANVTASGGSVFENGNNWRELAITVTGADNNPPEVDAGEDQTVGEGDTVTLSGSAADPDSGDSVESYSWSAPTGSGITFADGSSASTTFTAPAVDGDATFTLTLTAGDGTDTGTDTMDVTVKETGSAFITTWETTSNNEEITIPGTGTYSVVWGDGAATDETDTAEHEYADAGNHTVSITGGLERFNLNGNSANAPKLQSIEQWGDAEWTSMGGAFHGASNMAYNATDAPDLSGVADMSYMFHGAFAFDGDLSGWDVSKVTDMSNMFRFATSFDGDVSDWNVSQVEDMTSMFDNAGSFDGNVSDWDTSSVTNMGGMFRGASTFDGDVSDWNVSQATDMNAMFRGASVFDGDVSDWDVSSVTDMNLMFYSASVFDGDVSDWDVSSVTDMNAMFYSASAFDGNISGWDVSSVTNMNAMFRASSSFDQDLSGWNVSSVTDMNAMFYSASAFDGNLSGWDVSQVTDMNSMFSGATSFDQNLGNWYVVPADTAYAASDVSLNVTTISAQNSALDGHSPEYGIGTGGDSALFNMTGSTLMFKVAPSVGSHAANVTASEGSVFESGNNWRELEIKVTGADKVIPMVLNLAPADQISDGGDLELRSAIGITTFQAGTHTYAAVASYNDDGVQILNVTDPDNITATDQISDGGDLELNGASYITTFQIGTHTYAAVTAYEDGGVQILNVTDPTDITATDQISDGGDRELSGARGITTFQIGTHTYAAVASFFDNGVQILNVTDPTDITATDQISDGGDRELSGAYGITTFQAGTHTYAAVAAGSDNGVQILNVTDPTDITATDQINDGGSLLLGSPYGITTFQAGTHTYAAVAAGSDNGVQILDVTDPTDITATDQNQRRRQPAT